MSKKISFITLGCKLNYAETSTYEKGFIKEGLEVVPWNSGEADIYLVNTCSVTEHSDKKCRNLIRKVHRQNPEAAIFATGCYAQLKGEEVANLDGVVSVFGAREKGRVVGDIMQWVRSEEIECTAHGVENRLHGTEDRLHGAEDRDLSAKDRTHGVEDRMIGMDESKTGSGVVHVEAAENVGAMFPAYSSGERTRSFLKVQDGCDFKCNYCTVPYARGESRNIPICLAVKQAEEIAASGIKEIVITGVNTGDFGKTTGESFLDLLKALNAVDGIERYRISSIEPNLLTEEIVDWIASGTKFQPHFHIPLQSGCDTVLKEMGRRYNTADFAHKIAYIRAKMEDHASVAGVAEVAEATTGVAGVTTGVAGVTDVAGVTGVAEVTEVTEVTTGDRPEVFFGIDVIVGFPGETDELFEETYTFLRDTIKPAFIHIFPYSRRTGTPAATRKDQIQDSVKTERVNRLEALCKELNDAFIARNKGTKGEVLFESSVKGGHMFGYTGNYIRVERPYEADKVGRIVKLTI